MSEQQIPPWTYNGIIVTPEIIPADAVGFVYRITELLSQFEQYGYGKCETKIYIGKKLLNSTTRKRIGVREKKSTKTRKTYKVIKKATWEDYNSSCKPLQQAIKERPYMFTKEILQFCWSKRNLSWTEIEQQVLHDVLRKPSYNECVGGHFWKRDVIKPMEDGSAGTDKKTIR